MRCRVCRCSQNEPCEPPCSWVTDDLCSGCYDLAVRIREWQDNQAVRPKVHELLKLVRELVPAPPSYNARALRRAEKKFAGAAARPGC